MVWSIFDSTGTLSISFSLSQRSSQGLVLSYPSTAQLGYTDITSYNTTGLYRYQYEITYDGTAHLIYKVTNLDTNEVHSTDQTDASFASIYDKINIGINSGLTRPFEVGSIDLNAFKIYVDGNLVYQPCLKIPYTQTKDGKKIVDSIYRDRVEDEYTQAGFTPYYTQQDVNKGNYTVVGSPTISSDWVVSGFSVNTDYITSSFIPSSNFTSFELTIGFTTGSNIADTQVVLGQLTTNRHTPQVEVTNGVVRAALGLNATTWGTISGELPVEANTSYLLRVTWENQIVKSFYYSNGNWVQYGEDTPQATVLWDQQFKLGADASTYPFTGSIDLKQFSITVDGVKVYTATPNYTMATVEEDDIVASLDGATSYTQRADLSIEQQGTTTSGTAVTFPKAFIDTNYALSLPYSAKTATGFTAASDGDYIAEGNVSI